MWPSRSERRARTYPSVETQSLHERILRAAPAQVKAALQSAWNTNWNDVDDPDSTKETLVNVAAF